MIYLLDTNAFSDLMYEHPRLKAQIAAIAPDDRIVICTIVRGEILYGLERLSAGARKRKLTAKAAELFRVLPCESIPAAAADNYSRIKTTRQRKVLPLDENDLWIAATAGALGATLVSRDQDVHRIDGLAVADWTV